MALGKGDLKQKKRREESRVGGASGSSARAEREPALPTTLSTENGRSFGK